MVEKIEWAGRAFKDLQDIYEFIAKDSKRFAQIQIENIQKAVSNLANFPLMGRKLPEFPYSPYREILVGNYRVLYRYDERQKRIYVMAIVHGRRLLKETEH